MKRRRSGLIGPPIFEQHMLFPRADAHARVGYAQAETSIREWGSFGALGGDDHPLHVTLSLSDRTPMKRKDAEGGKAPKTYTAAAAAAAAAVAVTCKKRKAKEKRSEATCVALCMVTTRPRRDASKASGKSCTKKQAHK